MMAASPGRASYLRLCNITMPASHDAGVSTAAYDSKGLNLDPNLAIAQGANIAGQLIHGSRFFDLRFHRRLTGQMAGQIVARTSTPSSIQSTPS
jgi:hypothetical protein